MHEDDEAIDMVIDNDSQTETRNCQCGKLSGDEIKCEKCIRIFCRTCPSGPIPESESVECLECLFSGTSEIVTSTPEKTMREC